jgi:hypothetical protein
MPKVKKVDELAVLAEQLLETLGTRRSLGQGAYPPTLRQLAELCGIALEDGRVLKAVGKKEFTDKATAKATGKVDLESPIYFKEDVPSRPELERRRVVALAERMLRVLESQRDLGADAYPPTLRRLAELCGLNGSNKDVTKAAEHEVMASEVTFAKGGKPAPDSPVLLNGDLGDGDRIWTSALLRFAFDQSRVEKGKNSKLSFTPKQLASKLRKSLRDRFQKELNAGIDRKELPPEYAWLANKEPLIFRVSDLQPSPPSRSEARIEPVANQTAPSTPAPNFAEAFRDAFERLDRRNGLSNFVKLVDLRRELADFARERFEAGLRQLRVARAFTLNSHEGLLKPLTPEEREAGIAEAGSLLVYVSRR